MNLKEYQKSNVIDITKGDDIVWKIINQPQKKNYNYNEKKIAEKK